MNIPRVGQYVVTDMDFTQGVVSVSRILIVKGDEIWYRDQALRMVHTTTLGRIILDSPPPTPSTRIVGNMSGLKSAPPRSCFDRPAFWDGDQLLEYDRQAFAGR